jgi:hypothetical protein
VPTKHFPNRCRALFPGSRDRKFTAEKFKI